jgi:predicted kinase
MTTLWIPVGIPGCGKSTFAQTLDAIMISSDKIREEVAESVDDQSKNQDVFGIFHERIDNALLKGYDVFADATNLRDFAREKLRAIAANCAVKTHVLFFNNVDQAIVRNQLRDRKVPLDVMERMIIQYEQALNDLPLEPYYHITYISKVS